MRTYLVRLWIPGDGRPDPGEGEAALRGVVELAGSDWARPFRDGAELLALLRSEVLDRTARESAGELR